MAATIWEPGSTFVSGTSAAFLYGLQGFWSTPIEVSTVSNRNSPRSRLRVRRMSRLALDEVRFERGIAVASPRWTVLGLCEARHPRAERALDDLLRRNRVDLGEMWDLLDRSISRGRRGVRMYRSFLLHRTPGEAPTQSDLEDMFRKLVVDFNLPTPVPQWGVQTANLGLIHFDFGYPSANVAIELDSYAWHMNDRYGFDMDRMRDMEAKLLGIEVLRLTWTMMKWNREYAARMVRAHLASSSAS
jgi:hypothetical protein